MSGMPDVSIIIPIYNVSDYVAECISSVMAQDATCSIECILVDDRGSDNSITIARELLATYSGPIVFRIVGRECNGGLSAARNSGIDASCGRYLYFLDSDDTITSDCISSLYSCACRHPKAQITVGDFKCVPHGADYDELQLRDRFPEYSDNIEWIRSVYLWGYPITAWNKLIIRDFIVDNGLYFRPGILHEDNQWLALSYRYVTAIAFMPKTTYHYRMRTGSITQSNGADQRKVDNLVRIYRESFNYRFVWDRPWSEWVYRSMYKLRFSEEMFAGSPKTRRYLRKCALTLLSNPSCPLALRLVCVYLAIPRRCFSWTIHNKLYKRAFK